MNDPLRTQLDQWVNHNRRHILNHLDTAEGQHNVTAAQCARAQLDIVNRLERQLLLEQPVGAKWRIP